MKYFDFAATTPITKTVADAYMDASLHCFGNAGSLHNEGTKAKEILEYSRSVIADILSVDRRAIIFTSGGTESNVLGISTLLHNAGPGRKHVITSCIEHPSIDHLLHKLLDEQKIELDRLPHYPDASFCEESLAAKIRPDTALIIIQHANSETGALQNIERTANLIKDTSIYLHVDCVQSFGKMDISPIAAVADSLSISSHKIRGPKGVGACIFPNVSRLIPIQDSITHEFGFRSGTANIPGNFAFAVAAEEITKTQKTDFERIAGLRQELMQSLKQYGIDFEVVEGTNGLQLPHIIALLISNIQGQYVMMELNRRGYSISTGSACQAGMQEPSKTMIALGKGHDEAKSYIRISFGNEHRSIDCSNLAQALYEIIKPVQNKGVAL